ncbi:uracil-DNA glycosylase [Buchnera aphidicola]|uniref:Uracil-DNA glycosylase n=1 Tax=Buchnera aphidicola (Cinara strobi) TaxID=1921549 RepID=A0A3B1DL18_9GAMM|nr:Uracil-DNA glycosylase [Buchnera aphidicola (Cinara strobi)]
MNSNTLWSDFLSEEKKKKYFVNLLKTITNIKRNTVVFPIKEHIFNAFRLTPLSIVKVVILGQDPYYRFGQADGLSFSVPRGCILPPSLKNIFYELKNNFLISHKNMSGCLKPWAKQGVLLLNSILTVSEGSPGSHKGIGWEIFTDQVIRIVSDICSGVIFILWGSFSLRKYNLIDRKKHFILRSSHPSPLSSHRGFFGCRHFLKTNILLKNQKKQPIDWFNKMEH